ncbi:hypothetical protein LEP1GSC024_1563 [Leptospira noguchii str. 2001034031]|uniref:Uncharacterized protein n=1 Tax=Leptospira noguchii str. 2001034031 TaxID=1193053 RepID=M6YT61_9LEPT|nr:hypothetical protein LEP1GSC024_1563 [Leptospira noguchii str. 2001034031]
MSLLFAPIFLRRTHVIYHSNKKNRIFLKFNFLFNKKFPKTIFFRLLNNVN